MHLAWQELSLRTQIPYFLDQTPHSNSRCTQIVAASFTYLSFIVAALELSLHILIRAHLPRPLKRCPHTCYECCYCKYCMRSGHAGLWIERYDASFMLSSSGGCRKDKKLVKLLTKADSHKQDQTLSLASYRDIELWNKIFHYSYYPYNAVIIFVAALE